MLVSFVRLLYQNYFMAFSAEPNVITVLSSALPATRVLLLLQKLHWIFHSLFATRLFCVLPRQLITFFFALSTFNNYCCFVLHLTLASL